jgi:hypothetical protein
MVTLASETRWESDPEKSLGVTRGIYLNLPTDVPLWLRTDEFVQLERARLEAVLT